VRIAYEPCRSVQVPNAKLSLTCDDIGEGEKREKEAGEGENKVVRR
jgi:hypothetical protein